MSMRLRSCCLLILFTMTVAGTRLKAQGDRSHEPDREALHRDPQWPIIQAHLPDPATSSAEKLEMAGDILRARRFPEDALDYYNYALQRGGNPSHLFNKIGITNLELRRVEAARIYFERVVHMKQKNPEGWNNLGAIEYLDKRYGNAISDYKHAIKIDAKSATFHSNLGTAYFEEKDFKNARRQFNIALQIDPKMADHDSATGISAHLLSPEDRAHYCFEMARLYLQRGDEEDMMRYLKMSSEGGFDILKEMNADKMFADYRKDPRVLLLVRNAQALRAGHNSIAESKGNPQPLPAPSHE